MNASQFMDKQIMDLSRSGTSTSSPKPNNNKDFMDLMNTRKDDVEGINNNTTTDTNNNNNSNIDLNKEDIVPSYDFHPIRPLDYASAAALDSGLKSDANRTSRVWNSADSKRSFSSSPIRNYGSLDSVEPAKAGLEKERNDFDAAVVSEIDKTMKKYTDDLLHALDGVSARLTQLETRTRRLEDSVDDLKASVGNNYGTTDGKMRQLENILKEVQTGVQVLKDKQDVVEAQLQLAKLQVSKEDQQSDAQNTDVGSVQQRASALLQSHQQPPPAHSHPISTLPPSAHSHPISTLPPPNAPLPPPPQQNMPPRVQLPNQFLQNQISSVPQHEPYFRPPGHTPEAQPQQYQLPPTQPTHPSPMAPAQQQYQAPSQPPYAPPSQPTQPHPSLGPVNTHMQPSAAEHPEETPYIPSQNYLPNLRQPPSQPASGPPPAPQYYGAPPPMYEQPPNRSSSGLSTGYGPPNEAYPYGGPPSQYGDSSGMKSQPLSSSMPQSAGGSYPQLPTARVLPQALPTASGVGGGSGSPRTGNRVPIDDVVDKVTGMGFPREHVRATVRRLTENGQSVDLNVVLDKLMNDSEVQPPRGWFGR